MSSAGSFDFHTDQGARWQPVLMAWETEAKLDPLNLTDYGARLTVVRSGFGEEPVLELVAPASISLGGAIGTIGWSVPAVTMMELEHSVYNYELVLVPNGDEDQAYVLLAGRVLVREQAAA